MRKVGFLFLGALLGCVSTNYNSLYNHPAVMDYTISPYYDTDKIKIVAIFPRFDGAPKSSLERIAYDAAALQLLKTGKIDVVDRVELENILKEQEFSRSGLVDEKTAVKIGALLGAQAVLFLDFISAENDLDSYIVRVSTKLVEVETGRILYVASAIGGGWDMETAVSEAIKNALKPLIKRTNPTKDERGD
ncbi:MAG: hypothetical protein GXO39_06140 [Thermotogae bacterium]|nr:hypothetical protein [Thermotogota bacterium]